MFNELRVTYQTIDDRRTGQPGPGAFPSIRVDLPDGTNLRAGTENFSVQNELDQRVIEITDDLTVLKGRHSFTFGTHNEFMKFRNLFIRDNWGTYRFSSLDNFAAGVAGGYDFSFRTPPTRSRRHGSPSVSSGSMRGISGASHRTSR